MGRGCGMTGRGSGISWASTSTIPDEQGQHGPAEEPFAFHVHDIPTNIRPRMNEWPRHVRRESIYAQNPDRWDYAYDFGSDEWVL